MCGSHAGVVATSAVRRCTVLPPRATPLSSRPSPRQPLAVLPPPSRSSTLPGRRILLPGHGPQCMDKLLTTAPGRRSREPLPHARTPSHARNHPPPCRPDAPPPCLHPNPSTSGEWDSKVYSLARRSKAWWLLDADACPTRRRGHRTLPFEARHCALAGVSLGAPLVRAHIQLLPAQRARVGRGCVYEYSFANL